MGHCDRCKTVVEPRLSTQWFVKIQPLADKAIAAVKPDANGKKAIRITPEQYEKIYLEWMENIHDWCISRQLWWGHRIPAWHCAACHKITVAREDPTACAHCGSDKITQETDVLDTWFSSGLLPVSVFGWPNITAENRADFDAFYPTSLLVTGFDILFFWVARMIMLGCWFAGDVPMPDGQLALARGTRFPSARSTFTPWCATPTAKRCRRPRATSSTPSRSSSSTGPMRCASRWRPWPRPAPTSPSTWPAPRAIAPSPTRSGTPRASSS